MQHDQPDECQRRYIHDVQQEQLLILAKFATPFVNILSLQHLGLLDLTLAARWLAVPLSHMCLADVERSWRFVLEPCDK